mmetsp:Transcript_27950/g.65185  ORF Transcript_27950/g.65185 Transcript_27950/m.65185 type:complete len:336 (-) Transcript_27950:250-1257(-)
MMLAKGTPSKTHRAADFQRTPLPRRSLCGGSPLLWDHGSAHPLSPLSPLSGVAPSVVVSKQSSASTPTSAASSSLSTPSKIMTVSTPLRPCSWQKAKEMQDDIKTAIEEQSVPLLRLALQHRHPCPGEHALHEAVRQAHAPAVRLLLQGRAEPNSRCLCLERGCEFPLQLAASSTGFLRNSDRLQVVELLLKAGARPGPRRGDAEANTPLHDAARRGDRDLALLLLRHSADPNAVNGFGEAPLQLALHPRGDFVPDVASQALVETLLQSGACPWTVCEPGLPPATCSIDLEMQALLAKWSAWWRCRMLAWIRSRGRGQALCCLLPELLLQVARFL